MQILPRESLNLLPDPSPGYLFLTLLPVPRLSNSQIHLVLQIHKFKNLGSKWKSLRAEMKEEISAKQYFWETVLKHQKEVLSDFEGVFSKFLKNWKNGRIDASCLETLKRNTWT